MNTRTVPLKVADPQSAIRYLGEMQSRAMDPIHEPIQNLLDEGAKQIDVELDRQKHEIRIRGDARPITKQQEARRILRSICASTKIDKLGEKGVGMLSFVNAGSSMTMISQKDGKTVWLRLRKDDLRTGEVGSENRNRLPYAGSEVRIAGVSPRNLKYRFAEDRVIKDVKRRWGSFFKRGVRISVDGKDVASFAPPLQGDPFERVIRIKALGRKATIEISLLILKQPSELATVSITHRGQANFQITDVPLFEEHNAFTQGMLHGTISGDVAPINASRTGFQESHEFEAWVVCLIELEEELGKLIEQRIRTAVEARDAAMLDEWMRHLRNVFADTELASTRTSSGEGNEEGWEETRGDSGSSKGGTSGTRVGSEGRRGGPGRLPTVPYAGFTEAPPNIRVVRERKTFRINVNHPDFLVAAKSKNGRRQYIRELCMHEAYIYSLEGRQRDWYVDRADEFLGYWIHAFIARS